jgi:hypothetical protein
MAKDKNGRIETEDALDGLHEELVGDSTRLTDIDKVVNILEVLATRVEKLSTHSHTLT